MKFRVLALCCGVAALALTGCGPNLTPQAEEGAEGGQRSAGETEEELFMRAHRTESPWDRCEILLPGDHGKLFLLRRHAHPFMAEFERAIRFDTATPEEVIRPLQRVLGTGEEMTLYWYPPEGGQGPWLKLVDGRGGTHLVDVGKRTVSVVAEHEGVPYAVLMPPRGGTAHWVDPQDGGPPVLTVGESKGARLTGPPGEGPGEYFGKMVLDRDGRLMLMPSSAPPEASSSARRS